MKKMSFPRNGPLCTLRFFAEQETMPSLLSPTRANFIATRRALLAFPLAFALLAAAPARAETSATPVLDKIRSTSTIVLGYRESALPFSFADERG